MRTQTDKAPVNAQPSQKVTRRIVAADGYLDLKLPHLAIEELHMIEHAGDMQPAVDYVMGQALMMDEQYDEAVDYLQQAAENIPEPFSQLAWSMLSECFSKQGNYELAEVVALFAEEPAEMVVQNAENMGYEESAEWETSQWSEWD